MTIGGKREGSGRKSQWRSSTKMMRLPAKFEREITEYARFLDSESYSAVDSIPPITLPELNEQTNAVLLSLRPGDRKQAGALFKKLIKRLTGFI